MIITEFRITLPLSLSEFQIGQRFVVAELSKQETGGGEGVEVVVDKSFDDFPLFDGRYNKGQYTKKKYHVARKLPASIQKLVSGHNLEMEEESWNAFPYGLTTLANPKFMRENFSLKVESMHVDNDKGQLDNVLNLTSQELQSRDVIHVDFVNEDVRFYRALEDPSKFKSVKTGRGPLLPDWQSNAEPVMTCYKVVTSEFKWWGLQSVIEAKIVSGSRQFIADFSRKMFCWMDKWYGLTLDDIIRLENETKVELDRLRLHGEARGTWTYHKTESRERDQSSMANLRAKFKSFTKTKQSTEIQPLAGGMTPEPQMPGMARDRRMTPESQTPSMASFKGKLNRLSQKELSDRQALCRMTLESQMPILFVESCHADPKDISPRRKIVISGFNLNLVITYPDLLSPKH